jgi:uncharacterized protein (DUF983 family)
MLSEWYKAKVEKKSLFNTFQDKLERCRTCVEEIRHFFAADVHAGVNEL